MKKFLFSMALALGAICMPSQASAAEVITKDGTVIIVL